MLIFIVILVLAVAAVLGLAAIKPDSFRVERSIYIQASPESVFALINNFHRWGGWSPWDKYDPTMKRVYSGPDEGLGAIYEWAGNKKVGTGRMEIVECTAHSRLKIKLDFFSPFEAHNVAEFSLVAKENNTNITWAMSGPSPFISKVMQVFMSMDKLVGKDFETGLANLKSMCEIGKAGVK